MTASKKVLKYIFVLQLIFIAGAGKMAAQQASLADTLYQIVIHQDVDAAIGKYHALKKEDNNVYDFGEVQLNNLGYKLLGENRFNAADRIFQLNIEQFPYSPNVYDSYAECQLFIGNFPRAAQFYKKVIAMLPKADIEQNRKYFFESHARTQLFHIENFDPPSDEAINYTTYFGGTNAGKGDLKNMAEFKSEKPGLKMSYTGYNIYATPVPTTIKNAFVSFRKGDVVSSVIGGAYRDYIERGDIADITALWEAEGWYDKFPENFQKLSSHNGRQYFVPQAFQLNPIWYRKDVFSKLNLSPPDSWEALLTICDTLHQAGYQPFALAGESRWPLPLARWFTILNLRLNGPEFHESVSKGEVDFTDPRIKGVFQYWTQLFDHQAFSDSVAQTGYQTALNQLVQGEAAMYNLGEWMFESLPVNMQTKLGFFFLPQIRTDIPQAEIVHTYGAFLMANNPHEAEAKTVLKFLGSKKSHANTAGEVNRLTPHADLRPNIYFSKMQRDLLTGIKDVDLLVPLLEFNMAPDMAKALLEGFRAFCDDRNDIDNVLAKLENTRRELFQIETMPN